MTHVSNISFELDGEAVRFSFYTNDKHSTAYLQIPGTLYSKHVIDDKEVECWTADEKDTFRQLIKFYHSSFKDTSCAIAGALVKDTVKHVQEVQVPHSFIYYFVAFTDNNAYLLKEHFMRDYYNKFELFVRVEDEDDIDGNTERMLIEKAKKEYFQSAARRLEKELQAELNEAIKTIVDTSNVTYQEYQDFMQSLHVTQENFIVKEFDCQMNLDIEGGDNCFTSELANTFYLDYVRDLVGDFSSKLLHLDEEHYEQH